MTLFDFAYKNIIRDFKTYLYYFINCIFSVIIFFLFAVLSFHPTLKVIDKGSTMGLVLIAAEFVSIGFSIVFIAYSVSNFLKGRNQQFGLITLLGASKKQLNQLIFLENMIIGSFAIIAGIVIGMVFSKLFLTMAGKMIGGIHLGFYFPVGAIILTLFILGGVFLFISIITPILVKKQKIIKLIKTEEIGDKSPKMLYTYVLFSLTTLILLFIVINKDLIEMFNNILLPIGLIWIVTGSSILFYCGIYLYITIQMKTKKYFIGTKLLFLTNIKSNMKTNLQSLTLTTVLYTIAFLSIIIMTSAAGNVENETRKLMPYAYMYASWSEDADTENHVRWIETQLSELPGYKKAKFTFYNDPEMEFRQSIISVTQYNEMAKFLGYDLLNLEGGQVYLISGNVKEKLYDMPTLYREKLQQHGVNIQIVGSSDKLMTLSGYLKNVTVVSDEIFTLISGDLESFDIYAFDVNHWTSITQETDMLLEKFKPIRENREGTFIAAKSYYETDKLTKNLTLYIGSILCFSFLLAVASFIYSRLYSTMEKECEKYKGIVKIGLSKKELYKILNSFVKLIVLVPFTLALIYMWFGIFIIDKYSIISNIPTAIVYTIIYTLLQIMIYIGIKKMYRKGITKGVYDEY